MFYCIRFRTRSEESLESVELKTLCFTETTLLEEDGATASSRPPRFFLDEIFYATQQESFRSALNLRWKTRNFDVKRQFSRLTRN
jgi:hypothetical protein